mmetsp:Transcript_28025/g.45956  ORF Transcript_28025/g.45956 Transcript_28025/m.45956 type:complete len:125 (-) Transcript_28025:13-387(-)
MVSSCLLCAVFRAWLKQLMKIRTFWMQAILLKAADQGSTPKSTKVLTAPSAECALQAGCGKMLSVVGRYVGDRAHTNQQSHILRCWQLLKGHLHLAFPDLVPKAYARLHLQTTAQTSRRQLHPL